MCGTIASCTIAPEKAVKKSRQVRRRNRLPLVRDEKLNPSLRLPDDLQEHHGATCGVPSCAPGLFTALLAPNTLASLGLTGGRGVLAEIIAVRTAWQVMSFTAAGLLQ